MRRSVGLLAAILLIALIGGSTGASPAWAQTAPHGATARCNDGSLSYSRHRSGTCSHHGGVARWLGGTGARTATVALFPLGSTVLVGQRTRTAGCRLGPEPDPRCSPGAYYSRLTTKVICSPGFHTSAVRHVSDSRKRAVETEYGLTPARYGDTLEIDHIVPLELGGSNAMANLFPERANAQPGYHVKDRLEDRLHALVCSGSLRLHAARVGIATNWRAQYRRVFGVNA